MYDNIGIFKLMVNFNLLYCIKDSLNEFYKWSCSKTTWRNINNKKIHIKKNNN